MAIDHARSKLRMSSFEDIDKYIFTMATGDTQITLPNSHSFHVMLVHIRLAGTDTFAFSGTVDGTNYVILRAWDIINELYTTSASVTTSGIFTVYCEGMRNIRIAKAGATTPTLHLIYHKDADSHSTWTLTPFH